MPWGVMPCSTISSKRASSLSFFAHQARPQSAEMLPGTGISRPSAPHSLQMRYMAMAAVVV